LKSLYQARKESGHVFIQGIDFVSFCDFSTVLCNFADSVVFFGFQFIKQAMELLVVFFF
jgi:threonine aldolase